MTQQANQPNVIDKDYLTASGAAFDQVATRYDVDATDSPASRLIRSQVWKWLAAMFQVGANVLEIGCGTGEDAIWLAKRGIRVTATDASVKMLAETERKARLAGVDHLITTRHLDLHEAAHWDLPDAMFDGVVSNYGPLNCIGDWRALRTTLARIMKPGGRVGVAVMGPLCLWEIAWHGLHGNLRTATRRWRGQSTATLDGISFPVYYPTPARLIRDFEPEFRQKALRGLGVFLPPADLYAALDRRPRLLTFLYKIEALCAAWWPFKFLGDHYWLELIRQSDDN